MRGNRIGQFSDMKVGSDDVKRQQSDVKRRFVENFQIVGGCNVSYLILGFCAFVNLSLFPTYGNIIKISCLLLRIVFGFTLFFSLSTFHPIRL